MSSDSDDQSRPPVDHKLREKLEGFTKQVLDGEAVAHPGAINDLLSHLSHFSAKQQSDVYYMLFGFDDVNSFDLLIIRANLLIERAVHSLARSRAEDPSWVPDGYGPALKFAQALIGEDEDRDALLAARSIYNVRNEVAHKLEAQDHKVQGNLREFFRLAGVEPGDDFSNLHIATAAVCGRIGHLEQNGLFRRQVQKQLFAEWQAKQSQ